MQKPVLEHSQEYPDKEESRDGERRGMERGEAEEGREEVSGETNPEGEKIKRIKVDSLQDVKKFLSPNELKIFHMADAFAKIGLAVAREVGVNEISLAQNGREIQSLFSPHKDRRVKEFLNPDLIASIGQDFGEKSLGEFFRLAGTPLADQNGELTELGVNWIYDQARHSFDNPTAPDPLS